MSTRLPVVGAGRQHLGRRRAVGRGRLGRGHQFGRADVLGGLEIPVADEDRLQLEHDGSFDAGHQLAVEGLRLVLDTMHVLRADPADLAVHHDDLAVVAQIEARRLIPEAERKNEPQFHARTLQALGDGLAVARRADGVDQETALHAAFGGALERAEHLVAGLVVLEDVDHDMRMVAGGIDVGGDAVDHAVVVGVEHDAVVGKARKLADPVHEMGGHAVMRAQGAHAARAFQRHVGDGASDDVRDLLDPVAPPLRVPALPTAR